MADLSRVLNVASDHEFEEILKSVADKLVIADFHATWSGPCLAMQKPYASLSKDYLNCIFLRVDVSDHQKTANDCGIATVPAHPHLVAVTASASHQVRVYDTSTSSGRLLCKMGCNGSGEAEFKRPWGVVITADSAQVIIADRENHRLQLISLTVDDYGSTELAFVREIGSGRMMSPAGLALRTVGNSQTVLVAEYGGHQVSEWELDGTKVRAIGLSCNSPTGVTVLADSGRIAVTDFNNHRICVFHGESGSFACAFGSEGEEGRWCWH